MKFVTTRSYGIRLTADGEWEETVDGSPWEEMAACYTPSLDEVHPDWTGGLVTSDPSLVGCQECLAWLKRGGGRMGL